MYTISDYKNFLPIKFDLEKNFVVINIEWAGDKSNSVRNLRVPASMTIDKLLKKYISMVPKAKQCTEAGLSLLGKQ